MSDGGDEGDPADGEADETEIEPPGADDDATSHREGPLSDLAEEIDRRRASDADDPAPDAGDLFERRDVDGVDREALWEQVAGQGPPDSDRDGGGPSPETPTTGDDPAEGQTPAVEDAGAGQSPTADVADGPRIERPDRESRESPESPDADGPQERVIEKRKYCQQCEHFSAPPEVRCTHEGTTIEEAVDMDHFRVVDCPVVREDEELENV